MGILRVLLTAVMLVAATLSSALSSALASDRLTLVTGEDYPPYVDAQEPGGGLAVRLVQQVLRRMDVTAAIETAPWRRGYEETLRGRFDATFPYVRTADRERDVLYSDPLFQVRQAVFMPVDRRFAYRGPEDLKGRRVCTPLGYAPAMTLQAMLDSGQLQRATAAGAASCPGLLAADRADFFIQDLRIGEALVAKADLSGRIVAVSKPPFGSSELHLIVPRSRPDAAGLIARFNRALKQVMTSGDYDRLLMQ
jgi:polar amino acid transport system substrate-binding protein